MDPAADFVQRFATYWATPTPEKLGELLHPDVVLIQPLARRLRGLDAAQAEFRKLFTWLPDLRGEVDDWAARNDTLYIQFRLSATIGKRRIEWHAVDRFDLRGDKAVKRVSYFDSKPLLLRVVRHPSTWIGWWRSGVARAG